ncbi:MAG: DUF1349 domain-containing protein, partial [Planctomycetota bacterium]
VSYRNIVLTPIIRIRPNQLIFEETFDSGPAMDKGWTWLRENPNQWRIKDNALEILVQPGVAHNSINVLRRKAPDRSKGTFAFDVTVTNNTVPTQQYEQAGITWYNNDKHGFKFVKELVSGTIMMIPSRKPMPAKSVQLRLIVDGDDYTALFRPDARGPFQTAAKGKFPPQLNDQVSIQCYNGPPDAEHWIRFDDFRIYKLPE